MPLIQGKSKDAFTLNVKELVKAGHSIKQALKIAYLEKRKRKSK